MTDEQKPQLPPELQPFTQPAPIAAVVNANVDSDQVRTAHAAPDGEVQFIVHPDGSKSVPFADTPQRREED